MVQQNPEKLARSRELLAKLKEQRGGSLIDMHRIIANDPLLLEAFAQQYDICNKRDTVIPRKYRELMIMLGGAVAGLDTTVKTHAKIAAEHGATVEEIAEALRIVYLLRGVSGIFQVANVFEAIDEA